MADHRTDPVQKDKHPISMSSCAYDESGGTVAFTIKNLGDWSAQVVPSLRPGARIWVDGPYGAFTPDREQGFGYVLIGGGAGITPLYSMCQTFAERGDARPVLLLYGGRDRESLTFFLQLEELKGRMNLSVVYVLEDPPEDWRGERGYISADTLRRYVPPQFKRCQYFICGPVPLMDAMEEGLTAIGGSGRSHPYGTVQHGIGRGRARMRHVIVNRIVCMLSALILALCVMFAYAVSR